MRDIIYLVSTANTGFFYTTTKNTKGQKPKIEVKKYDPVAKKHVIFKEAKKPLAIKWDVKAAENKKAKGKTKDNQKDKPKDKPKDKKK